MLLFEFEEKFPSVATHTIDELVKKHGVDATTLRKQLTKGIKVEKEHTTDTSVAKEIALDHLAEKPDYYDRLAKVEEDVVDFPDKDASRRKQMSRLRNASNRGRDYDDASYDSEGFLDDFTQNSLYPPKAEKPKGPHLKLVK